MSLFVIIYLLAILDGTPRVQTLSKSLLLSTLQGGIGDLCLFLSKFCHVGEEGIASIMFHSLEESGPSRQRVRLDQDLC